VATVNPGRFAAPGIIENQFAIFQIIFGDIETTGQPNPFFDFYQLTVFKITIKLYLPGKNELRKQLE